MSNLYDECDTIQIYTDGASRGNPGLAAWGFVMCENNIPFHIASGVLPKATNNVAEYTACIKALKTLSSLDTPPHEVFVYSDSQLMIRQILNEYRVKHPTLKCLHTEVVEISESLVCDIHFEHLPRNTSHIFLADKLCNIILDAL